jgi:hypothetical protein
MKKIQWVIVIIGLCFSGNSDAQQKHDLLKISELMLYHVKTEQATDSLRLILEQVDPGFLTETLNTDHKKIAFWLNIYNAIIQDALAKNPELYTKRNKFFRSKLICIAGKNLSPDAIEHGILRKSSIKLSLGYFHKLIPNKLEKKWRVNCVDPRIHFALNCGAVSCPAINWYNAIELNEQLNLATNVYLSQTVEQIPESKTLRIPKLFNWFRGDFGGKKGIKKFISAHYPIEVSEKTKISFKKYYWELQLMNP